MNKVAIAVHGGAGNGTRYVTKYCYESEAALTEALKKGFELLKR